VGSAFIPVFKRYSAKGKDEEAWYLTSSVINIFMVAALVTCLILLVFARPLMNLWVAGQPTEFVSVAGQDVEFPDLLPNLARILLIPPAIFAVSTFCSSVLNSYNRFAIAAMAPLMYNLAIIAAALGLSGPFGIYGLAFGAVIGALLHLLIQLPFCYRLG